MNHFIARLFVAATTFATLAVVWVMAGPAVAAASPAAHSEHHGITLFNWPSAEDPRIGLAYLVINFLVLAFLIHRLILRKLIDDNVVRHDEIKTMVANAANSHAAAEAVLRDYQARIERIDDESRLILDEARKAAEVARKRLLAEAEVEVERFKTAAMAAATREVSQRRAEIESEVVERTLARATELLRERMTDADQQRLVDRYATDLGQHA